MEKNTVNPCLPYNYFRTLGAVKDLQARYKDLISLLEEGKSEQGRNIVLLKMGRGKRKILVTSAVHGREYVTTGFLLLCAEYYADLCRKNLSLQGISIQKLFCEYSFYMVPQCNPDSVEISLGREEPFKKTWDFSAYLNKDNANGVNINADFPFLWEYVPKERHPGSVAASQRETRFLMDICKRYEFEKMISLHSRGGCVYWRDAGNSEIVGDALFAEKLSSLCKYKLCKETTDIKAYSGGFENWFRSEFKRPAVCVELVNDENASFSLCCENFYSYTDWENTKHLFLAAI